MAEFDPDDLPRADIENSILEGLSYDTSSFEEQQKKDEDFIVAIREEIKYYKPVVPFTYSSRVKKEGEWTYNPPK